jgi:hypothetical protein
MSIVGGKKKPFLVNGEDAMVADNQWNVWWRSFHWHFFNGPLFGSGRVTGKNTNRGKENNRITQPQESKEGWGFCQW